MEESIEHSPNQQRRRSGYRSMVRKRHSRVWNESSERSVASPARRVSVEPVESCPVTVNTNLIYFDVNTEQIELTDADPLAQAVVLEKANQLPRESVVQPSQEFLRNVQNKFVKINDVIEPDDVPVFEEKAEPVQIKMEPVQPTAPSKVKANYSYTQFDLDSQMLDILEGADMLAGLGSGPVQQELKEWSSPPKPEKKYPVKRKRPGRRTKIRKNRRAKRYNVRQCSFSRDASIVIPDCPTAVDLSASIVLDFESDSEADFIIDYSRILSTPLRRRLAQIQNHIESPPPQVNRASIRRTFSRRQKSPEGVAQSQTPPAVVRRLSMESNNSDRNELSSDEELAATQIDPERLVPLEPSPEKENFNAIMLIKANINQLSQLFSQSFEDQEMLTTPSSREASLPTVEPKPTLSPISLSPGGSPRTLNIEWLFRSGTESESSPDESSSSSTSCASSQGEEEQKVDVDEVVVVKTEPDEALHRMLDDDDEFLVQLPTTQKVAALDGTVEKKKDGEGEVWNGSVLENKLRFPPPFIEPTRPLSVAPKPSSSFADASPKPTSFGGCGGGFQTASGSGIRVSAASLAKARSIWRDEDAKLARDESWQKVLALEGSEPGPTPAMRGSEPEEPPSFGFKTAKGGGIAISKEALEKAQLRQQQFELKEEGSSADQPVSFGFKTAKGDGIPISKEALAKAQLWEQQFEHDVQSTSTSTENGFVQSSRKTFNPPGLSEPSEASTPKPLSVNGFQTARGGTIKISEQELSKAQTRLQQVEREEKESGQPEEPVSFGFKTAKGGGISVSKEALEKAQVRLQQFELEVESTSTSTENGFGKPSRKTFNRPGLSEHSEDSTPNPLPVNGFQTARGGTIKISEQELAKAQARLQQVEREERESDQPEEPVSFGFKTAKGGGISVSKEALEKAQQKQQQFELEEERTCVDQPVSFGFKTAKGGGIAVSKEALAKAQLWEQQFENDVESTSTSKTVEKESELGQPRRKAFNPPGQKASKPSEDSTSKRLPDDELDPETPLKRPKPNRPHLVNFSTSTPNQTAAARRPEQPANDVEMADFFNDLDDRHFHELFCEENEPAPTKDRRIRPPLRQVRLASRFEECKDGQQRPGSAHVWDDSFGEMVSKLSTDGTLLGTTTTTTLKAVAQQVLDARRLARERQRECGDGKSKPEQERRPRLYEFVKKKKQQSGKISLRRFVGAETTSGRECAKVDERIALLSVENVAEFKFNVEAFYGKQFVQENTTGIPLGDPDAPINLHLDDNGYVGLQEFNSAFLAAPGIDPNLVPSGWIENAWKWILLKLTSMQRKLPQLFSDVTSPENVLNQLLFRYHVEIDCAKRSVVRKMLEKDDVPGKRMILFVSRIFRGQNPFEAEIELCDGWYPIRTVLDYPLTDAVLKKRIVVGTKLMIQGAELLNLNEGCAPLDVPVDVRLRIHANSTRRAHWLAKLGLYQVPTSFLVSCNHVSDRGGLVVRLQLVVVRVYPLMYVDKSQGSSVLRSGRVERRRNVASDATRFDDFQKLCSQVQKELESERTTKRVTRGIKVTRSTTTAQLLEMVDAGLDLSYIEYDLSATQRDALVNHQRRKQEEFAQEVNRRVKDLMASRVIDGAASEASGNRSVTPLLKVRVVDARKPEKTLMMSIWGPPEDMGEVVQERRVLEVVNLTASGSKNGEVQLKASKSSNYRVLDRLQFDLPEGHFRRLTKISSIDQSSFQTIYNEFDTIGVVIHVGNSDTKKFQIAYLADANMNLLGIHFWSGIKEYAYEDVVKERSILCVSNLQWRSLSQQSTIPSSYATEYTTFSEHSKAEHFTEELQTLKASLASIDLDQFYQDCTAKVMSVKDKKLPRSNSFNTPLRNSSACTPARTLLGSCNTRTPNGFSPGPVGQPGSLQKRKMELLAASYRSPPKKSPIVLRRNPRAGRNFKTPMRLEEKMNRALSND